MAWYKQETEDQKYLHKYYKAIYTCIDLLNDWDKITIRTAKELADITKCEQTRSNKFFGTDRSNDKIKIQHTTNPARITVYLSARTWWDIEIKQTKKETLDMIDWYIKNLDEDILRREKNEQAIEETTRKHLEYKDRESSIDYKLKKLFL